MPHPSLCPLQSSFSLWGSSYRTSRPAWFCFALRQLLFEVKSVNASIFTPYASLLFVFPIEQWYEHVLRFSRGVQAFYFLAWLSFRPLSDTLSFSISVPVLSCSIMITQLKMSGSIGLPCRGGWNTALQFLWLSRVTGVKFVHQPRHGYFGICTDGIDAWIHANGSDFDISVQNTVTLWQHAYLLSAVWLPVMFMAPMRTVLTALILVLITSLLKSVRSSGHAAMSSLTLA